MITLLYIALEAIAVLLLLHALYGKKMQWDKYSVAFILFDCALMSVIRWCGLNQNLSFINNKFIKIDINIKKNFKHNYGK